MKGHDDVITLLNEVLTAELTAIQRLGKVNVGQTVPEQLRLDLRSSSRTRRRDERSRAG